VTYSAHALFVPFALAILLTFVLATPSLVYPAWRYRC